MDIHPLPQGFGAEIAGFDLHGGRDPVDIERLRAAYDTNHLLIFRSDRALAPERQAEVAGWFGPVGANADAEGRPWTVLHNDEATGSAVLPFHSDISFMPFPIEGLSLHPLALPEVPTSTTFISNAVAWDALSADLQAELGERTARHYFSDEAMVRQDWPRLEHWHPVRQPHRRTGRPMLFFTEHHVDRIEGMDDARFAEVRADLLAVLYADERRYEHVWQTGDLLIWDNMAIQHARTRPSPPSEGVRILQRVALGTHNFADQLEAARKAAA